MGIAMIITDVRIKLATPTSNPLAYVAIEFDRMFVLHDLKIIEGKNGVFVSMPSRRKMHRCPRCQHKNSLMSKFCNECAGGLDIPDHDPNNRLSLYADVGHPINARCRSAIEKAVIDAYEVELKRSCLPDYVCRYHPTHADD